MKSKRAFIFHDLSEMNVVFEKSEHNCSLVKAQKVPKCQRAFHKIYMLLHLFAEFHSTSFYILKSECNLWSRC